MTTYSLVKFMSASLTADKKNWSDQRKLIDK